MWRDALFIQCLPYTVKLFHQMIVMRKYSSVKYSLFKAYNMKAQQQASFVLFLAYFRGKKEKEERKIRAESEFPFSSRESSSYSGFHFCSGLKNILYFYSSLESR